MKERIEEKIEKYLNEKMKKLKRGTQVWVQPLSEGEKKTHPEGAWVDKTQKVTVMEEVDRRYPAAKVKVEDKKGKEREVYVFQIDMVVK